MSVPSAARTGAATDAGASAVRGATAARYGGLFLIALATLLLELALTRVLSVALWYHFGFLVISTALLGFGAAGVAVAVSPRLRLQASLDHTLALTSVAFGVGTIVSFWLLQRIPFDPFGLFTDRRQLAFMPAYYLVISVPFFFSGLAVSLLLARRSSEVNRLYAADLAGAGCGCALFALVVPAVGGAGAVVAAATLGLLGAAVFAWPEHRRLALGALLLAAAASSLAPFADGVLPIRVTDNKHVPAAPLYTAWNSFSRVDVVDVPGEGTREHAERGFIIDSGTAASTVEDLRPDVRTAIARGLAPDALDTGVALVGKVRPSVLVIGAGAGSEVVEALARGAATVTAVEINPIMAEVMTRRMPQWWGGLWNLPEVEFVVDEGRSFVRRTRATYDAIVSRHTISNAAVASGALSLAENYVLTREAVEDYLDHLAPDGVLYFTRPEGQIPRLFATAREIFDARGLGPVGPHLYAFRIPNDPRRALLAGRGAFLAGFLLKKTPYSTAEIAAIEALIGVGREPGGAQPLFAPGRTPLDTIYGRLAAAADLGRLYAAADDDLAPSTDNRPFFNHRTRWSSVGLAAVQDVLSQGRRGRVALEDRPVAEVTLLALLAQAVLVSAALILWPLLRLSRQGLGAPGAWRFLVYFAGLGLGFIMIEITLLQRFTLFLGQPVYTFAAVLAALLVTSGAGSYLAGRIHLAPRRALPLVLAGALAVTLGTALLSPAIFRAALGLALGWRVLVAIVLVAPSGLALGMPFPTGLRLVAAEAPALVPWSWGVNGFFTVIGSVAALIVGMALGFDAVVLIALLCYGVALAGISTRAPTPAYTSAPRTL